jgi:hypothetical protein
LRALRSEAATLKSSKHRPAVAGFRLSAWASAGMTPFFYVTSHGNEEVKRITG